LKSRTRKTAQEVGSHGKENVVQCSFDVDPSISKIKDEQKMFVKYLEERYLTIDIFDA
jgi:hypothetical protein